MPPDPPPPRTRNLILVTLDGTRAEEIFRGADPAFTDEPTAATDLLPNIHRRLVRGGVALGAPGAGAPIVASGPSYVSLPGYLEILTGRPSDCRSNDCAPVAAPTLLDELRETLGWSADDVAVIASWETLARAATSAPTEVTISAGRHGGRSRDRLRVTPRAAALLDEAADAAAFPGEADYRPDRYTAALALEYLAARRPRLLFVGLGDTDEHAHRRDYAGHLDALRAADRFIGDLFRTLDALGDYGAATTVLVTTDHGRARTFFHHGPRSPESARVWLLAAGGAVPARGLVTTSTRHRLADIAPTCRALLGLASNGNPIQELMFDTIQSTERQRMSDRLSPPSAPPRTLSRTSIRPSL